MSINIFSIDHGNHSIKTTHLVFPCGLAKGVHKPYDDDQYIKWNDMYYSLRPFNQTYMEDKTTNENYLIYTLFAACMQSELDKNGRFNINKPCILAVGLPPEYLPSLSEKFKQYFLDYMKDGIEFEYSGKQMRMEVTDVRVYPQGQSVVYAYRPKQKASGSTVVKNKILQYNDYTVVDLGGVTLDVIPFRDKKRVDESTTTEPLGINRLVKMIQKSTKVSTGYRVPEHTIQRYLNGEKEGKNIPEECIDAIERTIAEYIETIMSVLEEAIGDLRLAKVLFIGGGSILLRERIMNCSRLNKENISVITDTKANAVGYYELTKDIELFNRSKRGVS